jgi:hypothetical protein
VVDPVGFLKTLEPGGEPDIQATESTVIREMTATAKLQAVSKKHSC